MVYRDQASLPADCPPADAEEIQVKVDVWRFVEHDPVNLDSDFESAIQEQQRYGLRQDVEVWDLPFLPCGEHGVSVHDDKRKAEEKLKTLQDNERRSLDNGGDREERFVKKRVHGLTLLPGAGATMLTSEESRHMEWWPASDFKDRMRLHEEEDR